jgi:hypothetical protein
MLGAGVDVFHEAGIEAQISSVSYAKVFEHLERTAGIRVTYASVHERIWDSLQEYQLAVIDRAGVWETPAIDDGWISWLRAAVAMTSQPEGPVTEAATAGTTRHYEVWESLFDTASDPDIPDELRAVMARLSIAIREGLGLRQALTGEPDQLVTLPTGSDGQLEEWTYDDLAMWALRRALPS